jgi:hypothetical protein
MLLSNAVSLNNRIKYLDAICDLGLELYGTENWTQVGEFSLRLLRCCQFGEFIKTRKQLVDLYQRSRISLNITHNQAVDGLPYRVFDIMASNSMLITEYRANSDLFRLFGSDMPIPMYRNANELRELTQYYLTHDKEREKVVRRCNELVARGFSFEDRISTIFDIAGTSKLSSEAGEIVRVTPRVLMSTKVGSGRTVSNWAKSRRLVNGIHGGRIARLGRACLGLARGIARPGMYAVVARARRIAISCVHVIVAHTTARQRLRLKRLFRRVAPLPVRIKLRDFVEPGHGADLLGAQRSSNSRESNLQSEKNECA